MLSAIKTQLPQAQWIDADLIVNWLRLVKSPAELVYMTQAAQIAGHSMDAALAAVRPGARQCDVMAEAVAAQIRGTPEFSGDMKALHHLMLAGTSASAAHPMWTDAPLDIDNAVAFELGAVASAITPDWPAQPILANQRKARWMSQRPYKKAWRPF